MVAMLYLSGPVDVACQIGVVRDLFKFCLILCTSAPWCEVLQLVLSCSRVVGFTLPIQLTWIWVNSSFLPCLPDGPHLLSQPIPIAATLYSCLTGACQVGIGGFSICFHDKLPRLSPGILLSSLASLHTLAVLSAPMSGVTQLKAILPPIHPLQCLLPASSPWFITPESRCMYFPGQCSSPPDHLMNLGQLWSMMHGHVHHS